MNKQLILDCSIVKFFESIATKKVLLIYSTTSLKKLEFIRHFNMYMYPNINAISTKYFSYDNATNVIGRSEYDVVIGLGGGTAIDIAKHIAHNLDSICVAIPSMFSTNVFATNKCAAIINGNKITQDAVLPHVIVLDYIFIEESRHDNFLGLADVLSISTALRDWVIAENENKDNVEPRTYEYAMELLDSALELCRSSATYDWYRREFDLIRKSGYITNSYGSGRPESGSEHIIAKEIEKRVPGIPHGIAIAAGIDICLSLQNNFSSSVVRAALDKLDTFTRAKELISYNMMYDILSSIEPRKDRFTILDIVCPMQDEDIKKALKNTTCWGEIKYFDSVVFDLDGTLWDVREKVAKIWSKVLGKNLTKDDLNPMMGKTQSEIARELEVPQDELDKCILAEIQQLPELISINDLYPGLSDLFRFLTNIKIPMFIVSNCQDGYIELFLELLYNNNMFTGQTFAGYENTGKRFKNKSQTLANVIEEYKLIKPLMVGDSYSDFIAAKDNNTEFIHAAYGFGKVGKYTPCKRVSDIAEIKQVLLSMTVSEDYSS